MSWWEYVAVPERREGGRVVVAAFSAQRNISWQGVAGVGVYRDAPTLAQLLHACELAGRGGGIDAFIPNGEWTADFVDYDVSARAGAVPEGYVAALLVRRPDALELRGGSWRALGGERVPVLLPPDGWVVGGFDGYTGLPRSTSTDYRSGAPDRYSYFWRSWTGAGLRAVIRECNWCAGGPFQAAATLDPGGSYADVGCRAVMGVHAGR